MPGTPAAATFKDAGLLSAREPHSFGWRRAWKTAASSTISKTFALAGLHGAPALKSSGGVFLGAVDNGGA
ncbi:MAG: hypothetical protein U0166_24595 [Acidobacteriota bacterium]